MKKIRFSKRRGEKRFKDREPKVNENVKQAFFVRGNKTSEISSTFLTDLVKNKKTTTTTIFVFSLSLLLS